ncbi:lysoplasmalogenase [Agromyces sp. NPDC055658]
MLPAFAPYLVVSIGHLVLQYVGPAWSVTATKALLMPLLALAVVIVSRRSGAPVPALLLAGIGLSWGGDVLLTFPGDPWFVAGLASFLAAHVAYIVLFLRMPRARRCPPAWALVYPLWVVAMLALLLPGAGALAVPVVAYALVIGAMAVSASLHGGWIALGGALFVVSDSVLAMGRFLPGYEFAAHDLAVMSTYLAAQGLIAFGVLLAVRGAAAPSRAPGRPVLATDR